MRPRFMNRGSKVRNPVCIAPNEASMRPRFMNRGSEPILDVLAAWIQLQ